MMSRFCPLGLVICGLTSAAMAQLNPREVRISRELNVDTFASLPTCGPEFENVPIITRDDSAMYLCYDNSGPPQDGTGFDWRLSGVITGAPFDENGVAVVDSAGELVTDPAFAFDLTAKDLALDGNIRVNGDAIIAAFLSGGTQTTTLPAAATTFVATTNFVILTGDGGSNTLATITGASTSTSIKLLFTDSFIVITDDDTHAANTIDLDGIANDFFSVDDGTLNLAFDGTSWYEISRSERRNPHGGVSVIDNFTETVIASAGVAVQMLFFDTNDAGFRVIADHTEDHLTIPTTGDYFVSADCSINSVMGSGSRLQLTVQKNNGAAIVPPLHSHRNIEGGGSSSGSVGISGLSLLTKNDTIELWIQNETNTANYVLEDCTLSVFWVG